MLIHPSMSMALAKTRHDDLVREVRPRTHRPRTTRSHREEAAGPNPLPGLAGWPGQALRRVFRGGAAEPTV